MKFQIIEKNIPLSVMMILIWVSPVIVLAWVTVLNYSPNGIFTITYAVGQESNFIENFASKEPDGLIGNAESKDTFQLITVSPLYFDVKVPREFSKAQVSLEYQNPDNQPIINLGVKQPSGGYAYVDMAHSIPELETLKPYWYQLIDGEVTLWQKNIEHYNKYLIVTDWEKRQLVQLDKVYGTNLALLSTSGKNKYNDEKQEIKQGYQDRLAAITVQEKTVPYQSLPDFFNNLPDIHAITEYNYNIAASLELPGYSPRHTPTTISTSMRGKQNIYTYIGTDEELAFNFTIRDFNHQAGADPVVVTLKDNVGNLMSTFSLKDDGNTDANDLVLPERILTVTQPGLTPGVYQLVFEAHNDDIFITTIEAFQHKIVFRNRLYIAENEVFKPVIGDGPFDDTVLVTDSKFVRMRTDHSTGLQKIQVGSQSLNLDTIGEVRTMLNLHGVNRITIPKNDAVIEGDGFFAFSPDQLFDPLLNLAADVESVENIDEYDFIIARYPQATSVDGWLTAQADIEVPKLYFGKDDTKALQAQFILSLPDLSESGRVLKVKRLSIRFEKEPFTLQNIFTRITNLIR